VDLWTVLRVVLRAVLFAVDRHRARQVTGIPAEERRP